VLDGNSLFPLVSHVAKAIALFSSQVPGVLVVSIGYPGDPAMSYAENVKTQLAWRQRDLSPPVTAGTQPEGTGGAADFLSFITQELKPFIASRYAVDPEEQTLAGDSMAGLFAVYTMFSDVHAFSRYVAISPSLFFDDHAMNTRAVEVGKRRDLASTRLFVAVGEQETKERMGEDMIGDARQFVSVLQAANPSGLEVRLQIFPDENHMTVVPVALTRGLLQVKALR
jgi:predicted alpha/beta superfamily hydrolase